MHDTDIEAEADQLGVPDAVAFLYRTSPLGVVETLWLTRYDTVALIVATFPAVDLADGKEHPGVVREISVSRGAGLATRASKAFVDYTADPVTYPALVPWAPEPWDAPNPLDRPCPF